MTMTSQAEIQSTLMDSSLYTRKQTDPCGSRHQTNKNLLVGCGGNGDDAGCWMLDDEKLRFVLRASTF